MCVCTKNISSFFILGCEVEAGISKLWWQDASKPDIVGDAKRSLCDGTLLTIDGHSGNLHNREIYIVRCVSATEWTSLMLQSNATQSSYQHIELSSEHIFGNVEGACDLEGLSC